MHPKLWVLRNTPAPVSTLEDDWGGGGTASAEGRETPAEALPPQRRRLGGLGREGA